MELKVTRFEPEYLGKLSFYLEAHRPMLFHIGWAHHQMLAVGEGRTQQFVRPDKCVASG